MTYKAGDTIVYTNADGTTLPLEAVDNGAGCACRGCVGDYSDEVCSKLPLCSYSGIRIVWKEAV